MGSWSCWTVGRCWWAACPPEVLCFWMPVELGPILLTPPSYLPLCSAILPPPPLPPSPAAPLFSGSMGAVPRRLLTKRGGERRRKRDRDRESKRKTDVHVARSSHWHGSFCFKYCEFFCFAKKSHMEIILITVGQKKPLWLTPVCADVDASSVFNIMWG